MKSIVIAAAFSLIAGTALAQGMTQTTTTTTTISSADESEMHAYIVNEHLPPAEPPSGFVVTNGSVVPPSVNVYHFPPDRHWNYEFATFGDQTVLIDPATHRIVHILH